MRDHKGEYCQKANVLLLQMKVDSQQVSGRSAEADYRYSDVRGRKHPQEHINCIRWRVSSGFAWLQHTPGHWNRRFHPVSKLL